MDRSRSNVMNCESAIYGEGNCLGSVGARLCHGIHKSLETVNQVHLLCQYIVKSCALWAAYQMASSYRSSSSGMPRCDCIFHGSVVGSIVLDVQVGVCVWSERTPVQI